MRVGTVGKEWARILQGYKFDSCNRYEDTIVRQYHKSPVHAFWAQGYALALVG